MGYDYWNDIEYEKTKPYWIEDESDMKLLNFIQKETNLQRCFQDALLAHSLKGRADSSGNQFYVKEYRNAIENAGLNYEFQLLDYPVYPKIKTLKAGNHFGIKPDE